MGEEHHHHPDLPEGTPDDHHLIRSGERRRLLLVIALTAATMAAEFVGSALTGSVALLGDAVHMLTHALAIGVSYLAIVIAELPAAPERTYHNWRAEILGSLFSGVALIPLGAFVVYEAVHRFLNPGKIEVVWMLVVAVVGLVVNLVCAFLLLYRFRQDLNMRGAFLHMVADSASSVGVIAAGVALLRWSDATWVDPLAAVLITLLIGWWAVGQIRQSCSVLLEAVPRHIKLEELEASIRAVEGVSDVHDLHVWTITSRMHMLTAHVRLSRDMLLSESAELGARLRKMLSEKYQISHPTFEFEEEVHRREGQD